MKMVEKVARASFACWRKRMDELGHHLDKGQAFEDMSESEMEFALLNARAMIETMREFKLAPMIINSHFGAERLNGFGKVTWDYLIDAALNQ